MAITDELDEEEISDDVDDEVVYELELAANDSGIIEELVVDF